MPATGVTSAGFVCPSLTDILAQQNAQILATVDPGLDLSPATPDGQISGIYAASNAAVWELAQIVWNAFNRQDVEGAGLDNLGDLIAVPREGSDYTQVIVSLALAAGTYAASTWTPTTGALATAVLLANVAGTPSQQFANLYAITVTNLVGTVSVQNGSQTITFSGDQTLDAGTLLVFASQPTVVYTVQASTFVSTTAQLTVPYSGTTAGATTATPGTVALFQAVTIGDTPTVNDGTLTQITTPVSGWLYVNNPPLGSTPNSSQTQVGESEETDAAYALRQEQDIAGEGGCTASATAVALEELGAAQVPPVPLLVTCLENTTNTPKTINGFTLPPHTYAPVIWAQGSTWPFLAGTALIAQTIYNNKPSGITSYGETFTTVTDPQLGLQLVGWTVPPGSPLYITAVVVPRSGVVWNELVTAIHGALVAAAIAPTPADGDPPVGQLAPGTAVVYSQLSAVIMGVPGVQDMQILAFGFTPNPTNVLPISLGALQIATILPQTVTTNVLIFPGVAP